MLAELMRLKSCVAIAGTHGKTTTTTMVATLLDAGGLDPTVINGGIINAYGSNARLGAGDWMVVEADESDGTFLKLPSDVVIVTNIDPEHLDHFKTFEAIQDAFRNFVENVPFYGFAVMCTDHPVVQSLVGKIEDRRIVTYGENPQADARLVDLTPMGGGSKFKVVFRNRKTDATHEISDIMLPMPDGITPRTRRRRLRWRMNSACPTRRSARRSRASAASSGASPGPANGTASP
jgi:UDP-N-acetylmuramate--alanine ligase